MVVCESFVLELIYISGGIYDVVLCGCSHQAGIHDDDFRECGFSAPTGLRFNTLLLLVLSLHVKCVGFGRSG